MEINKNITLIAGSNIFFSEIDENCFFKRLQKIKCIVNFYKNKSYIYITVDYNELDKVNMIEILSLFYRYEIEMKQLINLEKKEFKKWFRRDNSYWHESIFR